MSDPTNTHDQDSPLFRLHDHLREAGPQSRTGGGKNPLFSLADATRYCGFPYEKRDLLTLAYHNRQLEGERVSLNNPEIRYRQSALDDWIRKGKDVNPNKQFNRKQQQDPLYLLEEAARYTGRHRNDVSNAFHQGRIPGEHIPPFDELAFRQSVLDIWTGKHPVHTSEALLDRGGEGEPMPDETPAVSVPADDLISVSDAALLLEMTEAEVRRAYFQKRLVADTASRDLRFSPQALEDYRKWREEQLRLATQTRQKEQSTMQAVQQVGKVPPPVLIQEQEESLMERPAEHPDDPLTAAEAAAWLQARGFAQVTGPQRIFNGRNTRRLPPPFKKPGDKVHVYNRRADYLAWAEVGAPVSPDPALETPAYYDVKGAARYLEVSDQTVYNRVKAGTLERDPSVEGYRFTRAALDTCRARYEAALWKTPPAAVSVEVPPPQQEEVRVPSKEVPPPPVPALAPEDASLVPATNDLELELLPTLEGEEEEDIPPAPEEEPTPMSQPSITAESASPNQTHAGKREQVFVSASEHPVIRGLIGLIPAVGETWEKEKRIKWTKAWEATLDLFYPSEEGSPS